MTGIWKDIIGIITGALPDPAVGVVPELPDKLSELQLTEDKFVKITQYVIDGIEGGYYHPSMKKNFSKKDQRILGDSGETMYGLDRKHGVALAKYQEWEEFWNLIDEGKQNASQLFYYNNKSVPYYTKLKELAAKIMYQWFRYLAGKYILISSMDEIAADDRLILHFSYASWNGEGWFRRFANALNVAVQNYEGDKDMIWSEAIKARTESKNAVIRQQGQNLLYLIKKNRI